MYLAAAYSIKIGDIKERMKQFAFQFYLKLLCNKMFLRLLLSFAVFVTLTKAHFRGPLSTAALG